MSLPELSIKRPVFATVTLLALILLGLVSYFRMNVDEYPDASLPVVTVRITYEGALPEQIDTQITKKVEEAVGEAKGVKHIRSTSREGEAEIAIDFNLEIDPSMAAQDVRDKLSAIRGELPAGIKEPVIARYDLKAAPVVAIALTSKTASPRELSILVEDVIRPRLQKLDAKWGGSLIDAQIQRALAGEEWPAELVNDVAGLTAADFVILGDNDADIDDSLDLIALATRRPSKGSR